MYLGQKMVVVEDLISTGGSVLDAVAAAEACEEQNVLGMVAIFPLPIGRQIKICGSWRSTETLSNYTGVDSFGRRTRLHHL